MIVIVMIVQWLLAVTVWGSNNMIVELEVVEIDIAELMFNENKLKFFHCCNLVLVNIENIWILFIDF